MQVGKRAKRKKREKNEQWVWIVQKIRIDRVVSVVGRGRGEDASCRAGRSGDGLGSFGLRYVARKLLALAGTQSSSGLGQLLAGKVGGGLVAILGAIGLSVHPTLLVRVSSKYY